MLHFHPLVIYRRQVLKQADVVLAMYLRGEHFTTDQKRRNFDYYDPMTTGDSSLSACVQSIVAAVVGRSGLAADYFDQSLYLDLANTHGNTPDGVHVANAGGVWAACVQGFAGMIDTGSHLEFHPRLPDGWTSMSFRLLRHGSRVQVTLDADGATVEVLDGQPVPIRVALDGDRSTDVEAGDSVRIPVP
jgi:alpha,alpha-trehalose phosphorylase